MTDKKKIDEAAILNVSTTENGMTGETTFVADDAMALARLLKTSGIESSRFNGPAMLSVDVSQPAGSVTSRIQAPDLRSIMRLLEPEFQAASDLDTNMVDDLAPQTAQDSIEIENPEIVDQAQADELDATLDVDVDMGVDLDEPVDETADLDYRDHDAHPVEYPGMSDRPVVQPITDATPSRSSDNPLKTFQEYVEEANERKKRKSGLPAFGTWYPVGFRHDDQDNGQDTSDDLGFDVGGDDMFAEDDLNELSRSTLKNYVSGVNADDYRDASDGKLERRGRGISNAQAKMVWKDARVLAREATTESLLDEFKMDEARGGYDDYQRKQNQYGPAFHLNTDCGYASLNDLGAHDYFQHDGVVVLEIDRNGKKGLNFVAGSDRTPPGTQVTCVTATSTGQKYRPGKVIDSFTMDEYTNDRAGLEKRLARHGITPTKKLSVKTFD
jgi:hypothetical protein